jgi:Xaa-Pro aminopeptidase
MITPNRLRLPLALALTVGTLLAPTRPALAQERAAPLSVPPPPIAAEEFAARRDALAALVEEGVVVAFGGRTLVHDFGTFFQLPSFRYLTDYDEPDGAFVMVVRGRRAAGTLFITPLNARTAFYYGQRADTATSEARYGMPARSFAALPALLDSLAGTGLPFYTISDVEDLDFASADSLTRGQLFLRTFAAAHPALTVRSADPLVLQLRARKSDAELALIRRAVEISSAGHRAAMLTPDPTHEYELRASLEYTFTRLGAERVAYGSIVGAGINGTQLHYMKDTDPVRPGDVVVMDAAGEYHGYAADITRTIPVSGRYTPEQRALYQLVRDAQDVAERNSKPGMRAAVAADSSVIVRARGLAALGLIESVDASFDPPWPVDCARQAAACRQSNLWMIHGISHGLGLAVHDPVQASFGDRTYQVGDAFTIEPGIYVSTRALDALPDTPKNRAFIAAVRAQVLRYQDIGVRIEDDYVITDKGLERISTVPREIDEIEALMRQRRTVVP